MPTVIRTSLAWLVTAEMILVALLVVGTWHMVAAARPDAEGPAAASPGASPKVMSSAPDPVTIAREAERALLPGLRLCRAWWRSRVDRLRLELASFGRLEWRLVHAAADRIQRYSTALGRRVGRT